MNSTAATKAPARNVDPQRLLYSLMLPAFIMPLAGWMFSVSLPIIRDDFQISADSAAWIATAFSLPFMILMPVYGRISDGLGKRRLLLFGISVFALGGIISFLSTDMRTLLIGRLVQGIGASGLVPLALALLSEAFAPDQRGKAMGTWSTIGPLTGVIGPILAGFIVARWGWRPAFLPSVFASVLAIGSVYFFIPGTGRSIDFSFLKSFDWWGVLLLGLTLTSLLVYLSSRPITGVPPLQDWRLLALTIVCGVLFVWVEKRRPDPFIKLSMLNNRSLVFGSFSACLRMICLSGGMGFLMPLYMADVFGLDPTRSGFFLMLNPAAMVIFVRFGGGVSDRLGSRRIVMTGFAILCIVMFSLSRLTNESPLWMLGGLMVLFGIGAGLMLASLHRAALSRVSEENMGTSSGIYSMVRFLGSTLGAAVGGILLQFYHANAGGNLLPGYQSVYLWYLGFAFLGIAVAALLPAEK